jgi:hypothetical protein
MSSCDISWWSVKGSVGFIPALKREAFSSALRNLKHLWVKLQGTRLIPPVQSTYSYLPNYEPVPSNDAYRSLAVADSDGPIRSSAASTWRR